MSTSPLPLTAALTAAPAVTPSASSSRQSAGNEDQGPSFSKVLADQGSSAQKPASGKVNAKPGKPVAEQKPAAEQPAASDKPATSPDDKTVDASKPADDGSSPAADAAVPVATLPQQALDIAAQVAAVQNQVAARQQSVAVPADSTAMPAAVIKAASSTPLSTASAQDTPAQQGQAVLAAAVTDTADKTDAASAPAVAAQAALPQQGTPAAVRRPIPTQHHGTTPPTAAKAGTRQDPAALAAGTQPDASTRQALPVADPSAVPAPSPNAAEGIAQHQVAAFSPVEPRAPQAATASPAFSLGLAGTPVLDVPSPVGSARWGADLGRQMVLLSHDPQRGRQTAELRLDPPDLGPLRVTINLNDGIASASFVSAHAAVRQALESALPQLEQAFAQAGLSLGQTSVGEQDAQAAQDQTNGHAAGGQAQADAGGSGQTVQAATLTPAPRDANALVDTFA